MEFQFSSVSQFCLTLLDPMNLSTPGLPVHHQIPEFIQTQVHRVSDAIHLSAPSPPAFSLSQHRGLFISCWITWNVLVCGLKIQSMSLCPWVTVLVSSGICCCPFSTRVTVLVASGICCPSVLCDGAGTLCVPFRPCGPALVQLAAVASPSLKLMPERLLRRCACFFLGPVYERGAVASAWGPCAGLALVELSFLTRNRLSCSIEGSVMIAV